MRGAQEVKGGASDSSSDNSEYMDSVTAPRGSIGESSDRKEKRRGSLGRLRETNSSIGGTSSHGGSTLMSGSLKSQKVAEQVKALDIEIKKKLQNNYNSVRKAFLELDENHSGFITAEELAKFLGASKDKNFDFTLLEILIKLKTTGMKTKVYYKDFCAWLGSSIEPTEGFFFRHDSKKNPQFEINLMKNIENRGPN